MGQRIGLRSYELFFHLFSYCSEQRAKYRYKTITIVTTQPLQRETSTKGTMDPGVHATVVTAGHYTHAELTSGHALASCYNCCVHPLWVYAN